MCYISAPKSKSYCHCRESDHGSGHGKDTRALTVGNRVCHFDGYCNGDYSVLFEFRKAVEAVFIRRGFEMKFKAQGLLRNPTV